MKISEMKYQIIKNNCKSVISRHKSLTLANQKLRSIDSVKYSLHATDVDWLQGQEEALQGYYHSIVPID